MIINDSVLKAEEKIIFSLRSLYEKFGYKPFKIKKFEEYDLYAKNKDFLVSGNVITFTDIDGKLMALKPDVTLSIVKNSVDDKPCKLYYNENVYRVTKGATSYKEIMQAGVEIIGDIDAYLVYEMLSLSALSLATVSNEYLLNISDLGIVSGITGASNLTENGKKRVLDGITCKNEKQVKDVLNEENITGKYYDAILALVNIYGNYSEVFSKREVLCVNEEVRSRVDFLLSTVKLLDANGFSKKTRIDFSFILDTNYYTGIVFNGVIPGANGYVADSSYTVTFGSPYGDLPTPTKDGHTFIGWFTQPEGGEQITSAVLVESDVEHTLYAQYTVNTYTLYFNTDGGTEIAAITADYGTPVSVEVPTKENYLFAGWTLNGEPYELTTMPSGNVTLKAVWELNTVCNYYQKGMKNSGKN